MNFASHRARRRLFSPGICFGLTLIALSPDVKATTSTYNAVSKFSTVNNPTDLWRDTHSNSLLSRHGGNFGDTNEFKYRWSAWSALPVDYLEPILDHVKRIPLTLLTIVLPPSFLVVETDASDMDVRFVAPATETYSILGNFMGFDTGRNGHHVEILDDGDIPFGNTPSDFGLIDPFAVSDHGQTDPFSLSASEVWGLTRSADDNLSTGLDASTGSLPADLEPPAYSLIPAGLAFVAFGALREGGRWQRFWHFARSRSA